MSRRLLLAIILLQPLPLFAQEQTDSLALKSQDHLFNPTPKSLLRELSTDRPDRTESPYTVDAGHYQIETSFIDYTYDHKNREHTDTRLDTFSVMPVNLKAGLLPNADLQVVLNPYIYERSYENGTAESERGFGDIQTRLKLNLWGNDGGKSAFAAMPFMKFPTNTDDLGNDAVEGGLILPLAISLPAEWNMGLMAEFDFNRNDQKKYYADYVHSITFAHQIIGELSGYVEFFSSFNDQADSDWLATVDTGVTYGLTENIQLDMGINIGVTRAADDFNPFLGLSVRY